MIPDPSPIVRMLSALVALIVSLIPSGAEPVAQGTYEPTNRPDALTLDEIASLVLDRGFGDPVTATAVVWGESRGHWKRDDPRANNTNGDGSTDRGLWQINDKWHRFNNPNDYYDVGKSTTYALAISEGGRDFKLWNATKHPDFPSHLVQAQAAVNRAVDGGAKVDPVDPDDAAIVTGPAPSGADQVLDAVGLPDVGELVGYGAKALRTIVSPEFWRRAGLIVAGVILLLLGAVAIFGRDALSRSPAGMVLGK